MKTKVNFIILFFSFISLISWGQKKDLNLEELYSTQEFSNTHPNQSGKSTEYL